MNWCSLSENDWTYNPELLPYDGLSVRGARQICETMMSTCSTVYEAVNLFFTYNVPDLQHSHIMIADKYGNSAVVEWAYQEVRVIYQTEPYQILTNFTLSYYLTTSTTPCWRYNTAKSMLEANAGISREFFRDVLDAVHQESEGSSTIYSNIYDLAIRGKVILFRYIIFSSPVTMNVAAELQKGKRTYMVKDLFGIPEILNTPRNHFNKKDQRQMSIYPDVSGNLRISFTAGLPVQEVED